MTKPAHLIAEALREIRQDKVLTVDANGKRMTEAKRERYARHIAALDTAIEGYHNLARRQAENNDGGWV